MTGIRVGVVFPQGDLTATDGASLRRWARGVQQMGYRHLLVYDHVVGRPGTYPGTRYHEALTLLAHLAAAAPDLELATGVVVLPQRQVVLVAKQVAELGNLAAGRLRVGFGTGWNRDEYDALGASWDDRGDVLDHQLDLLDRLWTGDPVTSDGPRERLGGVHLDPPPQVVPPVWLAGMAPRAVRRVATRAAGWMPAAFDSVEADLPRITPLLAQLRDAAATAGRDPSLIGVEVQTRLVPLPRGDWARQVPTWREHGITHLSVATAGAGPAVDDHLALLDLARRDFLPTDPNQET